MVIFHCGPSTATTVSEPVLIFRRQLRKRSKIRIVCVPHTGDHTFKVIAPKLWSSLYRAVFPCMFPIILAIYACVCMRWSEGLTVWLIMCLYVWTTCAFYLNYEALCNCVFWKFLYIPAVIISISTRVINTLQHSPVFIDQSEPKKIKNQQSLKNEIWHYNYCRNLQMFSQLVYFIKYFFLIIWTI